MALKWFSKSFKSVFLICIFGCSSIPQKGNHLVMDIEKQADEHVAIADRYRLQGRPNEALLFYRSAENLYFKKWQTYKYVITGVKETSLLISQNKIPEASERYDYFKRYAENAGVLRAKVDLNLAEAMLLYAHGKAKAANHILDDSTKRQDVPEDKKDYMLFYRVWKSQELPPHVTMSGFKKNADLIISRFESGELDNPEVAYFSSIVMAEFLEHRGEYQESWDLLKKVVDIHTTGEVTVQWPRIMYALSRVADKLNQPKVAAFYKEIYEQQSKNSNNK